MNTSETSPSDKRHDPFSTNFQPLMKEQRPAISFGAPASVHKKTGLDMFKPPQQKPQNNASTLFSKPVAEKKAPALFKDTTVTGTPHNSSVHSSSKCAMCGKSTVLGFTCKCGHMYCTKHRLPEHHGCTFDHGLAERSKLAKANPVVAKSQIDTRW
ncbi:AN1-like Zinc finger [Carpediemonas membranifera]|uniref:AN1-like Zinc finger n=1 Tax=Carpediemonas membranifera TaxID=201153 RepID=A0A8J6E480_9EUKA|nr:AN1-like Zinc finger [Carpediemonas membranifera]|eukprot:KAG9396566.1 AN1-like Zinc finger [Carpediemonas membranifera]